MSEHIAQGMEMLSGDSFVSLLVTKIGIERARESWDRFVRDGCDEWLAMGEMDAGYEQLVRPH